MWNTWYEKGILTQVTLVNYLFNQLIKFLVEHQCIFFQQFSNANKESYN